MVLEVDCDAHKASDLVLHAVSCMYRCSNERDLVFLSQCRINVWFHTTDL